MTYTTCKIIFLFFCFVVISILSSLLYILTPTEKESKEKRFVNFQIAFLRSMLAMMMLPLILSIIGNDSLSQFVKDEIVDYYNFLELIGYITAVSIAGGKVITTVLNNLNLKSEIEIVTQKQKEISNVQKEQIRRNINEDLSSPEIPDGYVDFLISIQKNTLNESETFNIEEKKKFGINKNHINCFAKGCKYRITSIGKAYIQLSNTG